MQTKNILTNVNIRTLTAVEELSSISVCRATNETLAEKTRLSEGSIKKSLRKLRDAGRILPVTSKLLSTETGKLYKTRCIYIVSSMDTLTGAKALATLCRLRGKHTSIENDKLCGQLRCTEEQLASYMTKAIEHGWISVEHDDSGKRIICRRRVCEEVLVPPITMREMPPPKPSTRARFLDYLAKNQPFELSNQEAAQRLASSVASFRKTLAELVEQGSVRVVRQGKNRSITLPDFETDRREQRECDRAWKISRDLRAPVPTPPPTKPQSVATPPITEHPPADYIARVRDLIETAILACLPRHSKNREVIASNTAAWPSDGEIMAEIEASISECKRINIDADVSRVVHGATDAWLRKKLGERWESMSKDVAWWVKKPLLVLPSAWR